jgi:16S rRNA (cytidine1402-2'-O)-methyltransferase
MRDGTLPELAERYAERPPKGEIVIAVGPPAAAGEVGDDELDVARPSPVAALAIAQLRKSRRRWRSRKRAYSRRSGNK